jgi:RNA polymerase sigma-70 factor (ECF subfamily)
MGEEAADRVFGLHARAAGLEHVDPREEAFHHLVAAHRRFLCGLARSYARGEWEDLYQEMLFQLWQSLPSYRGEAALGTWVYRVALNTAISHSRRRRRRADEQQAPLRLNEHEHLATAGGPHGEDAILEDFLTSLNEIDRSILILYLDGLTYERISEVTGLGESAVGVRLHRIKAAYVARYLER